MSKFKDQQQQFRLSTGVLMFAKEKTLFTPNPGPGIDADVSFLGYNPVLHQWNTVFTNFTKKQRITQKRVFEQPYLVNDIPQKIKWKITDETRDIAGYTCRRANGVLMDSVYVVAFYTDQIHIPGGPELFSGLPGMILGVALPDEHITWFATSVTEKAVPASAVLPPAEGKAVDNAGMSAELDRLLKAQRFEWNAPYLRKATFLF